ncbi:hypothetical protein TNCT_93321 [Trichonephila clavata]|uniref:Uncharacterized protein n=1 Tax=Trichonephila clavata TaxID=2740835 RepID=A0A8X6FUL1_TRICU|nr:hypothetical protein TNCT_93321 [Trichonephila clavata]
MRKSTFLRSDERVLFDWLEGLGRGMTSESGREVRLMFWQETAVQEKSLPWNCWLEKEHGYWLRKVSEKAL